MYKTLSATIFFDTSDGCEGYFLRRSYQRQGNISIDEEDVPLDATTENAAIKEAAKWLGVSAKTIQIGGDYP